MKKSQCDVYIVCALQREAQAVLDCLSSVLGASFEVRNSSTGLEYRAGRIPIGTNKDIRVHVSWAPRKGPVEMVLHLYPHVQEFSPRWLFMAGICAGDRRIVQLGDIVVAESAFFYDSGKWLKKNGEYKYEHDTNTSHGDGILWHALQAFEGWRDFVKLDRPPSHRQQIDWILGKLLDGGGLASIPKVEIDQNAPDWHKLISKMTDGRQAQMGKSGGLKNQAEIRRRQMLGQFPFRDRTEPEVFVQPMASGSAVRADDPFDLVRGPVRGAIAIDMEGAAFYRTAEEFRGTRPLIVKAVSDYAGPDKDDSFHKYATEASALYLCSVIKKFLMPEDATDGSGATKTEDERLERLTKDQRASQFAAKGSAFWRVDERTLLALVRQRLGSGSVVDSPLDTARARELLRLYYAPNDLGGLVPYAFNVDGQLISTNAVTKREWLGHRIVLDSGQENCRLSTTAPRVSHATDLVRQGIGSGLEEILAKHGASIAGSRGLIWDDPIFALTDVGFTEDRLDVSFALNGFEAYRYSMGLLYEELEEVLRSGVAYQEIVDRRTGCLPLRTALLPDGHSLLDFSSRITAGGVHVLFAMATDRGFVIPLQVRSNAVTEGGGMIGTVPIAFHQPLLSDAASEVALSQTVYRELFEELFGGREVRRGLESWRPKDWFFDECEQLGWLRANKESYVIEALGLTMNLLSGNYDFQVLFVVGDPEFHRRFGRTLRGSWETRRLAMVDSLDTEALREWLVKPNWADQSLPACVEGLVRLDELAAGRFGCPERIKLPKLERMVV